MLLFRRSNWLVRSFVLCIDPVLTSGLVHPYYLDESIPQGFLVDVFPIPGGCFFHRNFCKQKKKNSFGSV